MMYFNIKYVLNILPLKKFNPPELRTNYTFIFSVPVCIKIVCKAVTQKYICYSQSVKPVITRND